MSSVSSQPLDASGLLCANVHRTSFDMLPHDVVETTKKQILDLLGVTLAGANQPGAKQVREFVEAAGGKGEASILGAGTKAPVPDAAQVNATMAHAHDYDDVHERAVMHPGVAVIPPALAIAEKLGGVSGRDLITAVAVGVDAICRLGLATQAEGVNLFDAGWHLTSLYGFPTAAITSGRLLGLSEEQLVNAFGIAYHQCAGNAQGVVDGATTKRLGPGFAVRAGVVAAYLAGAGVSGATNSLEGPAGLFKVYLRGNHDRDAITDGLGERFEGSAITIKPYPCCRGVHAAIDAALELREQLRERKITHVHLGNGPFQHDLLCEPFEHKCAPRNPVDAQFSIPWGVATALAKGRVGMNDYTPDAIHDPLVLALTAKSTATMDPSFRSDHGVEPTSVELELDDGTRLVSRKDEARGTPAQPLSFDEVVEKFMDCAAFSDIALERLSEAIDMVGDLESVTDVRDLIHLFGDPERPGRSET